MRALRSTEPVAAFALDVGELPRTKGAGVHLTIRDDHDGCLRSRDKFAATAEDFILILRQAGSDPLNCDSAPQATRATLQRAAWHGHARPLPRLPGDSEIETLEAR